MIVDGIIEGVIVLSLFLQSSLEQSQQSQPWSLMFKREGSVVVNYNYKRWML